MVRSWQGVVWALVVAMAVAVAVGVVAATRAESAPGAARRAVPRVVRGARSAPGAAVLLNEFLAGPARDWDQDGVTDARGDEWVEVRNVSEAVVAMDEFRLADADTTIRYAFAGSLAPGGILLVTGSGAMAWQRSVGRTATGLSLNNAGDTVFLLRVSGSDTTVVDSRVYGSIEGASDRSTGRPEGGEDGWVLYDSLNPYTGSGAPSGTGCPPTPGAPNGCTTDVGFMTWGAIKKLYR